MANVKKPAKAVKEKKYIVIYDDNGGKFIEEWVIGSKQDIIDDFNKDPDLYLNAKDVLTIYELGPSIPFKFVTPQIVLDL
jgi:hypothetical protein